MRKFLVTGGCGFIGSHLVDSLIAKGHGVRVLDNLSTGSIENLNPRAEFVRGDVTDKSAVTAAMADAAGCFHLAALSSVTRSNEDWLATHRNNQTGSLVVFDTARAGGAIPVVYASSAAVYGEQLHLPIAETATLTPLTAYGADKVGSELHGRVAWLRHRVPNVGLRIFNAYGPRQDARRSHSGAISTFVDRLLTNKSLTIHGDGGQVRDFVHVTDVVDHLLAAMSLERKDAQVVNVCTGTGTTVTELIDILAAAAKTAPRIVRAEPRSGDIRASVGDPARARKLLQVDAAISLADGVADLVARAMRGPRDAFEQLDEVSD